jgi:hypothetical protein
MTKFLFDRFSGSMLVESAKLVGAKRAVRHENTYYLSPAMMDLLLHATHAERIDLLQRIEVIVANPGQPA